MEGENRPLPFRIVSMGKHMGHLLAHRLSAHGLNRTQTTILTVLRRHPGLQAQDLCIPAGVEPANVTRTLQALERLGLVDRQPHPTDGRASIFSLTDAGRVTAEAISQEIKELFEALMRGVDPQDLTTVERVLDTLWRNVRDQFEEAGYPLPVRPAQKPAFPGLPESPTETYPNPNGARGSSKFEEEPGCNGFHHHVEHGVKGADRSS